jgi:superfamily II DNA/RNA helicase
VTTESAPAVETAAASAFAAFGLSEPVLAGVLSAGYKTPTPIQAAAIPVVLAGKDLVAQARTGTGKTVAFGLPAMSRLKFTGKQLKWRYNGHKNNDAKCLVVETRGLLPLLRWS